MKTKNKVAKKAKADKGNSKEKGSTGPGRKAKTYPISKAYRQDKENAGLREGSFVWAGYKVWTILKKGRPLSSDEITRKVKAFCKETGIKFKAGRMGIVIAHLRHLGLLEKTGRDTYAKTTA